MLSMLKFYFLGFLWFPIFSDESVSDNFWFVGLFVCLFVCLFVFRTCTVVSPTS